MFVGKLEYKLAVADGEDTLYTVEIGRSEGGEQQVKVSSPGVEATADEVRVGGIALRVLMDTLKLVASLHYGGSGRVEVP